MGLLKPHFFLLYMYILPSSELVIRCPQCRISPGYNDFVGGAHVGRPSLLCDAVYKRLGSVRNSRCLIRGPVPTVWTTSPVQVQMFYIQMLQDFSKDFYHCFIQYSQARLTSVKLKKYHIIQSRCVVYITAKIKQLIKIKILLFSIQFRGVIA